MSSQERSSHHTLDAINDDAADVLRRLDTAASHGKITPAVLDEAWRRADELQASATADTIARIHELRAIIVALRGSADEAAAYLLRAKNSLPKGGQFVSPNADIFLASYNARSSRHNKRQVAKALAIAIGVIVPLLAVTTWLNSDEMVIANADPAMIALADRAGMTTKGKAIFLRADPQLLSQNELEKACAGSNVANDEVDGCYDPLTGAIFVRDMPARFDDYEVVIASHEMLHAAFSDTDFSSLEPLLEAEVNRGHQDIQDELKGYTFEDDQARADELHAHLGTQVEVLPQPLESHFSQFFTSRSSLAKKYKDTLAIFTAKEYELSRQAADVEAAQRRAEYNYNLHTAAAASGSQSLSNYYYGEYDRQYEEVDRMINDYNKAVREYNSLVDMFRGRPLDTLEPSRFN